MIHNGRRKIFTDVSEVNDENVLDVVTDAMRVHQDNVNDITYLYDYYRGIQPILQRVKAVRPEINNHVLENRANEIVSFKSGYLMGEPMQYVSRSEENSMEVNDLNTFVFAEEKSSKDKELSDWLHICGIGIRVVLPDLEGEEDESPFELYTVDPRDGFVVYSSDLSHKPVLGVVYYRDEKNCIHATCYSKNRSFVIDGNELVASEPHVLGDVPVIEYQLNTPRMGAFEPVIPLLDAINTVASNRVDSIEQFVQAIMVFTNVDLTDDMFKRMRSDGAIKIADLDDNKKAGISYLTAVLNQQENQVLVEHMYNSVLTICGMPNRNGGSSTSDTGSAVMLRDGWSAAEARAKDSELWFKLSERKLLKVILQICKIKKAFSLRVCDVDIRFTRRNYENIAQKSTVLTQMLGCEKIHPKLAFQHSGMFPDPDLAYTISKEYTDEQSLSRESLTGDSGEDFEDSQEGESSGAEDRESGDRSD